jgi:starch synthase (maltosyl-transferring)
MTMLPNGPCIYNLFPLLAGAMPHWTAHLERARRMEFDWIFINPIQLSGYSGSLYSIKDYYAIDPRFVDPAAGTAEAQLRAMLDTAHQLGFKVMIDLVINHTAFDSPLVPQHPSWYRRSADGRPVHPSAQEDDHRVTWGDLFEIDNSSNRDGLWDYWIALAHHYAGLSFDGFRCDAAYKVPMELWRQLTAAVRERFPDTMFFAESLGCPPSDTLRLASAGFDYIFNSSKWWDFSAPWCLDQYRQTAPLIASISFPESHDTARLAAELNDREAVKMRYGFAALFATGVMMPIGFEFGFHQRLNVVKSSPRDWETPAWDISEYIAAVNRLKRSRKVFNEEGPAVLIDTGNQNVFALMKLSKDSRERALILLNKNARGVQSFRTQMLSHFLERISQVEDISPAGSLEHTADFQTCSIRPAGFHVLWAHAA